MARSLIKHMAWLAAASLLGAAARHLWGRRLGSPERRRDLRGAAVQRWEDEGGLVPEVEAQTPAAPAAPVRRATRSSAGSSANGRRRSRKPRAAAGTAAAQG
jgi:hypothetical protein